jgi:hypothetical protein
MPPDKSLVADYHILLGAERLAFDRRRFEPIPVGNSAAETAGHFALTSAVPIDYVRSIH